MDQSTLISLVSLLTFVFFMLGVPIFLVISTWVIGVSLVIDFTLANFGVTLFEGLSSFALLALPLFILAGDLMKETGIAKRLADFAFSVVGWIRGGMALTSIGACGLFAAVSGSNSATTAAIGSIMNPELLKQGYDGRFAAATIASGGVVGIIIPPSIVFIVYGVLLKLPVGDLFVAGLLPGVILVIAMQLTAYLISRVNGWGEIVEFRASNIARAGARAYLGLLAIVIVLFGIYSGIFSPTEAAGITVGFTVLAGMVVTRSMKFRDLPKVLVRSSQLTAMLAPMVAISVVMQQIFAVLGVQEFVNDIFAAVGGGYYGVLALCMVMILVSGMIIESIPNTIIFAPILAPIAASAGVDPIHFAVIFMVGTAIGFITPPYGLNLYVASGVTGIPYLKLVKFVVPYLLALISAWLIIVLVPWFSEVLRVRY
ncbi:TRAP transporter large permease [Thalassospiraceae bacterium LMO-JJ14]|nr:TRAP transporter large permease [Thalassospiraceae bacterium LMO-JJ14]